MFFTATEEPCRLIGDEIRDKEACKIGREYLKADTFILCNPNAMAYQNMINYPHAYYLKYFLNKQMNVMVYNYRGYGRTKGAPEPMLLYQEIEQVYHFVKYRIGVQGKIGVYGRSIGCTAACRLSPYVDMLIADRGFGDLYTLAERKFHGIASKEIFKLASDGWQANNAFNYAYSGSVKSKMKNKPFNSYKVIM